MSYRSSSDSLGCLGLATLAVLLVMIIVGPRACTRAGGFGPVDTVENATVITKHVDAGKEASSYMVTTDKGTFEVDNGWLLGVWNSDEIYGQLEVGKTYNLTIEGEKTVWWFLQYYPYITKATPVAKGPEQK
jgi:hypothetical protein